MTSENKEDYFNSSKFVVDFVPQSSIFAKRKRRPSRASARPVLVNRVLREAGQRMRTLPRAPDQGFVLASGDRTAHGF